MDELESHLREGVENLISAGSSEQAAFDATATAIGQSDILKSEFARAGGASAHLKHFALTLAGIPDEYVDSDINPSLAGIESGWATYLRAGVFISPAIIMWLLNMVFVFPKLREIYNIANVHLPEWMLSGMALAMDVNNHFLLISMGVILVLGLLEWRSQRWPRYRRAVFGIVTIGLNIAVLIGISVMVLLSTIAASNLASFLHTRAIANLRSNRFADISTHVSPFTSVHFEGTNVFVTYEGVDYTLEGINNLPAIEVTDFCQRQYGNLWKKRIAQDIVIVLADMGHPSRADHTVTLSLADRATGQIRTVQNAKMTEENRNKIADTWD